MWKARWLVLRIILLSLPEKQSCINGVEVKVDTLRINASEKQHDYEDEDNRSRYRSILPNGQNALRNVWA